MASKHLPRSGLYLIAFNRPLRGPPKANALPATHASVSFDLVSVDTLRVEPLAQRAVIRPRRLVTDHPAAHTNQCTRTTIAHSVVVLGMGDGLTSLKSTARSPI